MWSTSAGLIGSANAIATSHNNNADPNVGERYFFDGGWLDSHIKYTLFVGVTVAIR